MKTFDLIKLISGVIFAGWMILVGMNNKEPSYMVILAGLMTFGILYGIGTLPYSFLIFIILSIMMYTYVLSGSIEDTLFNVLFVSTVCIILGMFGDADIFKPFRKLTEGFYFNKGSYDLVSHSLNAMQCQNACQQKPNCKYAFYPFSVESGTSGNCYNTKGKDDDQKPFGGKKSGYAAWRNKFYTPKKIKMSPFHLRWFAREPKCTNTWCGVTTLHKMKEKCSENTTCDGFSWSIGKNWDNNVGLGCMKVKCNTSQEGRNGFGYGKFGFWAKGLGGKKCDERIKGWRQNGYRGCTNKTISGRTCQKWADQYPHKHSRVPFPKKCITGRYSIKNPCTRWVSKWGWCGSSSAHKRGGTKCFGGPYQNKGTDGEGNNYCRNPDGESGGIWCYTTDRRKRWEYCKPS